MHKNILLVFGITILFLGIAIQPAIAFTPNSSDKEEDCNICLKISESDIIRIKNLLNRIKIFKIILPILSKWNPEVKVKYQEFSDIISTLPDIDDKDLSANPWRFPVFNAFCNIVKYLFDCYLSIYEFLMSHLSSGIFIIGLMYSFLIELILLPMFIILYPFLLICFDLNTVNNFHRHQTQEPYGMGV